MGARRAPRVEPETAWVVEAYRRYFGYVFALLGRLGVPDAALEDVVQEVFVVLHRRRHVFRHESSIRTWLHGIAVHTGRRYRAKARRHADKARLIEVPEPPVTPESETASRESLQLLDRLLDRLPDDQREVFVLIDVAEIGPLEVAQLLELKPNTVYSRLRLARRRLRRALEELEVDKGVRDGSA